MEADFVRGKKKRALQFIRSKAEIFNINGSKIILSGNSAGAGASLWIAYQDDMKDPSSADPVLRESTRVLGVAIKNTQATYNFGKYVDVFKPYSLELNDIIDLNGERIPRFYGITSLSDLDSPSNLIYRNSVDLVSFISSDDHPMWASNTSEITYPASNGILNHHPYHVRALKTKADDFGVENVCYYGIGKEEFKDSSGENMIAFCVRKLNED